MYLNHAKMSAYKTGNSIIIVACGISSFFNLVFILFISLSSHFDHGLAETMLCLITFGLMSIKVGILIWRALMIHRLSKCRIYNSIIEEDHDGIIAYTSIAKMVGRPEVNIIKDISKFGNGNTPFVVKIRPHFKVGQKIVNGPFFTIRDN